jgi:hypothetical protein
VQHQTPLISGYRFEQVVRRILEANGFSVTPMQGHSFDFLASERGTTWAVEVKFYRTPRAQVSLLEAAAAQLANRGLIAQAWKAMLVVSAVIPPAVRAQLQQKHGMLFADRTDLASWAARAPELLDELHSILEDSDSLEAQRFGRGIDAAESTGRLPTVPALEVRTGRELCAKLHELPRGRNGWEAYEHLCDQILRFLFAADLHGWHKQLRTDDGFNRFDYVCRIGPTTEFWRFLLEHLGSRYVLFEFKNYTKEIRQGQVLTTEKYLLERGLRRVAVIITRVGADKGARAMIQGAMREQGKLMLVLNDDHVCRMLHMKDSGEDPTDLLFDVADAFLLSLSR